ncbi:MAG TPA: hypothetical protein VI300_28465 [Solirubrobacter sp.]
MRWIALVAVLVPTLLAPVARAETLTASADSPRAPGLAAGQDLAHVQSTFDDSAGTWTVVVTLQGTPEADGYTTVDGVLRAPGPHGCDAASSRALASLSASTDPSDTAITSIVTPTTAPRDAQSSSREAGGAAITLRLTDTAFSGQRPDCLSLSLSRDGVLDALEAIPFVALAGPLQLRFLRTNDSHTVSNIVAIVLRPFSADVTGTMTVRPAHGSGRALGTAAYRAKAGAAVVVRVRLRAAARRSLTRAEHLSVRFVATARAGSTRLTRSARATLLTLRPLRRAALRGGARG